MNPCYNKTRLIVISSTRELYEDPSNEKVVLKPCRHLQGEGAYEPAFGWALIPEGEHSSKGYGLDKNAWKWS